MPFTEKDALKMVSDGLDRANAANEQQAQEIDRLRNLLREREDCIGELNIENKELREGSFLDKESVKRVNDALREQNSALRKQVAELQLEVKALRGIKVEPEQKPSEFLEDLEEQLSNAGKAVSSFLKTFGK